MSFRHPPHWPTPDHTTRHHHPLLLPSRWRGPPNHRNHPRSHPRGSPKHKDAICVGRPMSAALTPMHDILERQQRSIANARRRFTLVAVRCRVLAQQTWDLTKSCDATVNWTFTVSDKRNTAPAFAFTTATACLGYRPLPKTSCRSTFPENPRPSRSLPFFIPLSYRS